MANERISELPDIGAAPADGDELVLVDISDTTGSAAGTTKKVAYSNIKGITASSTDTLTNKTIDGDNNTISNIALGAEATGASTDLTDTADLTYNADTDVSANGWVVDEDNMASNLATKVPTQQSVKAYVDASGGGVFTELADETIGSDAATWDVSITTTGYKALLILGLNLGADGNRMLMKPNNDTTTANYVKGYIRSNGSTIAHDAAITGSFILNNAGATSDDGSAFMIITNPASTSLDKGVISIDVAGSSVPLAVGGGKWENASAITSLRFLVNGGGNIAASSRVVVWGIA